MEGTSVLMGTQPADNYGSRVLPLRRRAEVVNDWLKDRQDTFIPELMAREGFDMWIINTQEYNEDPVVMTLLPEPAMNARRRTILVFARNADGTVDRFSVDRYGQKGYYDRAWDPKVEGQYECLARIIGERNPQRIGLNVSRTFAFGDGLSHGDYEDLAEALGPDIMSRTESAERMAVGWLEHRTKAELVVYPSIVALGHAIIAEAFSSRVIQAGVTTCDDVRWWMREKMSSFGLRAWFMPDVEIQAADQPFPEDFGNRTEERFVIMPGDVLHCDMGFLVSGPGHRSVADGLCAQAKRDRSAGEHSRCAGHRQ